LGALIGYFIIIADICVPILQQAAVDWYTSRWFIIIMFAALVAFPLSNLRTLSELAGASVIAIASIIVVMIGIAIRGAEHADISRIVLANWSTTILETLPICMFAYGNTLSVVPLWMELKPKYRKFTIPIFLSSLFLCLIVYTLTGVFGYLDFGSP